MNMKAALYIRVSTYHQIDKDSLPFQRQELSNYAKYVLGIDDFEIFEDAGYSAKNTDRPRYQDMMSRIRNKEFTHMLVWKIDRISRNLKDFTEMYEDIKNYGITFISKNEQFDTSSAMGEAMLKIILVFAELERKLAAERVFSIMLSRAEKGLWNGATVPLGYKWSDEKKFPVVDPDEADVVRYVYTLYMELRSTSKVATALNDENVRTKRGGKWTAKTVSDILRNPFYIGTYRYNVKTSGTRKYKDKKEWVVVEDNHESIIDPESFLIVGDMMSLNYRGGYNRSNTNIHIFSQILFCGKCGANLNAGLDNARNDGYRPSRYTCATNRYVGNIDSCNNFVSDVTLLPFVLNYISNFINLQDKITQKHSLRDIERILLRGIAFVDVMGIDKKALEDTYAAFTSGFDHGAFEVPEEESGLSFELENLKKEKQKYEKALSRLEDLYLYSEESMSEKDFLFKKRDISDNIDRINASISSHYRNMADTKPSDISFLNKAGNFLMVMNLSTKRDIDFREFVDSVDKSLIREFIQTVIDKIVVVDKKIVSITFQNGLTHNFMYKPIEAQRIKTKEKYLYKSFEPVLIDYLKEHGSVSRVDVEKITGLTRTTALALISELIDQGLLEKKGNSTAIRYFYIEKETT